MPSSWATEPKPLLLTNASTAGYLCGGAGILSDGFATAEITSLWNIDHNPTDPVLSDAILQFSSFNFTSTL